MLRGTTLLLLLTCAATGCVDLTRPPELASAAPGPVADAEPLPDQPDAGADAPVADAPDDVASGPDLAPLPPDAPLVSNGQLCATDDQCQSGACVRGLCCDGRCGQSCFSCALPGSLGACTAVP